MDTAVTSGPSSWQLDWESSSGQTKVESGSEPAQTKPGVSVITIILVRRCGSVGPNQVSVLPPLLSSDQPHVGFHQLSTFRHQPFFFYFVFLFRGCFLLHEMNGRTCVSATPLDFTCIKPYREQWVHDDWQKLLWYKSVHSFQKNSAFKFNGQ